MLSQEHGSVLMRMICSYEKTCACFLPGKARRRENISGNLIFSGYRAGQEGRSAIGTAIIFIMYQRKKS